MSHVETIALVTLGTIVLGIQFLRGPRPDPKLAAEPLAVTLRYLAASFGYFLFLSVVAEVLPRDVAPAAITAITLVAIAATTWWRRRHPVPAQGDASGGATGPQSAEEVAFSTGEWVRGLVPVLVIGVTVLVVVALGSAAMLPR